MSVFSTYLIVFLLKFQSEELVGCVIWFRIQRVPTLHTFDGPRYPKNKKYLKKRDDDIIITFFQVFLVFGVAGSIKSMQCGYSLDAESNSASNELSRSNLSKNTRRYVENTNKKSSFLLWKICQFNHYGWLILLKFYWFLNSNSQEFILGAFSYKAHFRPKNFLLWVLEHLEK